MYLPSEPPSLTTTAEDDPMAVLALRLTVPYAVETEGQAADREALAAELGLTADQIPQARRDEIDLEIEWTITNNGDEEATARLSVVGANELFAYDPAAFITEDEEDAPPPLMGGKPYTVAAGKTLSGVLREDELAEAAQDLDAFTRGGVIAQRALIERWTTRDVTGGEGGLLATIPSAAIPALLQLDVSVAADQPVTLTATLRVRDRTGRLRPDPRTTAVLLPASTTAYAPPMEMP